MKVINKLIFTALTILTTSVTQAGTTTLDFNNLNASLTKNSFMRGISTDGTKVTGVAENNGYRYTVIYTGADFDEDGNKDTLSFELLVEGFSDSAVTYSEDGHSAATIGSSDIVTIDIEKGWTVNNDMSKGNSLKFSIVNIKTSIGTVSLDGINAMHLVEGGSNSHLSVIGEGNNLDSFTFNSSEDEIQFIPARIDTMYITGATTANEANWGVSSIDLRMSVTVGVTVSAKEMNENLSTLLDNVPWDWSTPKTMRMITGRHGDFNDNDLRDIGDAAMNLNITIEEEYEEKLHAWYPDKLYRAAYMNLGRDYSYDGTLPHPDWYVYNADGSLFLSDDKWPYFNLKVKALREWWLTSMSEQIDHFATVDAKLLFIDGFAKLYGIAKDDDVFYDYWGKPITEEYWMEGVDPLLNETRDKFGDKVAIMGNIWRVADSIRDHRLQYSLDYTNIAYLESWERGDAESVLNPSILHAIHMTNTGMGVQINLDYTEPTTRTTPMTEAQMITKAKAAMPELWEKLPADEQQEIALKYAYFDVKLAYALMFVEERTYIDYAFSPLQIGDMGTDNWRTVLPFPEWDMPLGKPLGVALQNGNIWRRSFEQVDVVLNLDNGTAQYTYKEPTVPETTPEGSEAVNQDDTTSSETTEVINEDDATASETTEVINEDDATTTENPETINEDDTSTEMTKQEGSGGSLGIFSLLTLLGFAYIRRFKK